MTGTAVQEAVHTRDTCSGLVLPVILLGQFMIVSAVGSMNLALPSVKADLAATDGQLQWIVVLYQLIFAAVLGTGGRLGDVFGRKRVFVAGTAVFSVASLIVAVATTPEMVIAGRLVQGVAAGAASPQVLAFIQLMFVGHRRRRAVALFAVVSGGA